MDIVFKCLIITYIYFFVAKNLEESYLYITFANVNNKQIKYFTDYEQKTNSGFNRTRYNSD